MKRSYLASLSTDELWALHEKMTAALVAKIAEETDVLEERLRLLNRGPPRQYPAVSPKFRNPDEPSQTWAGRGKQPRWLRKQFRSGKRMDDFRIESVAA